ncbi:Protein of unknown function [Pseudomonas flavescens]|uniref:DUF1176 domain-containing protein n=1 Tax=Phytopseudomonas flavescens TaxID=29435 RepID=A0A1G8HQZ0_9GAMM|nr:DUF1176 domain-containing protein [Pseudomonas flavescens]SDI08900.1 Protein of unknown function [Pseudomonas flavescens]
MIRTTFALLLALGSCSAHAAEEVPLYRHIKDWLIGCDNTRQCTAMGAVSPRDDTGTMTWTLRVTREAGPQGDLRVGVFSYNAAIGQPLLDGKPLKTMLGPGLLKDGDVPEAFAATGATAEALIAELHDGQALVLPTADGDSVASLSGMSAALLMMDAVQGRVGTSTALIRQGPQPASRVPDAAVAPPRPAWQASPALSEGEAKRVLDAVMAATRHAWEADLLEDIAPEGQVFALNARDALVIIQTGCAAYNCAYSLYQAPLQHPEQAQPLLVAQVPGMPDMLPMGSIEFDPSRGELSSYEMAMGMGGCGTSMRWRYDGHGFSLIRVARMATCMGLDEGYWPMLWRTAPDR